MPSRLNRIAAIAGLAALLAHPHAAHADLFTLFVFESPAELALRTDTGAKGQAYWASYGAFGASAKEAGILRGGSPLHAEANVKTVRLVGGEPKPVDGPAAKADLKLGGYFQIDVPDMAAAVAWAAKLPASRSGAVEVRAAYPAPGM